MPPSRPRAHMLSPLSDGSQESDASQSSAHPNAQPLQMSRLPAALAALASAPLMLRSSCSARRARAPGCHAEGKLILPEEAGTGIACLVALIAARCPLSTIHCICPVLFHH